MPTSSTGEGGTQLVNDAHSDSEFQTQGFEPHESDAEQLWDVVAIRGEKKGKYLVQWAGADENGNPWPDSWVPREDITDDLVEVWKKEKAAKKKEKARILAEKRNRKGQGSSASASRSRTNSKRSTTTTSTVMVTRPRRAPSSVTTEYSNVASVSTVRSPRANKRRQRTISRDDDGWSTVEEDIPRKRRKVTSRHTPRGSSVQRRPGPRMRSPEEVMDERLMNEGLRIRRLRRRTKQQEDDNLSLSTGRQGRSNGKSKLRSGKTIVHKHEEEEEEEDHSSDVTVDPALTRTHRTRKPEVVIDTLVFSKAETGLNDQESDRVASGDGPSQDQRIRDRRPTPPRRTLAKSKPKRPEGAVSATSFYTGSVNGKRRKGPPGVRPADLKLPDTDKHPSTSVVDLSEDNMNKYHGNSRSPSIKSTHYNVASPSSPRRELRAHMNGNAKTKTHGYAVEPISRTLSPDRIGPSTDDHDNAGDKQMTPTPGVSPSHAVQNTFDEPDFGHGADDKGEFDPFGPIPQVNISVDVRAEMSADNDPFANDDRAYVRGNDVAGSREELSDEPQLSKGSIIPPTQSQSQSQSQAQPVLHDVSQDDAHFESILSQHGSTLDADIADLRSLAEEPIQSSEAGIRPATLTSSLTDPQSSAMSNGKVHKKLPVWTPSKFKQYLPQQKPLSALLRPRIAPRASKSEPATPLESPVKDFDEHTLEQMHHAGLTESQPPGEENMVSEVDDIEGGMPQSLEFRQRGLELAEIQRKRIRQEIERPTPRIPLDEWLLTAEAGTSSGIQPSRSEANNLFGSGDESKVGLRKAAAKEGSDVENDVEARVRQFEEDYLDFDGNSGTASLVSHGLESIAANDSETGGAGEAPEGEEYATPEVDELDASEEADVEESLHDVVGDDPFLSRTIMQQRELTPTTTSSQQDDMNIPYTPVRNRFKILGSPTKLESPKLQTPARRLNEAMGLLHTKSEEIEYLKQKLAESEKKRLSQDDALAELQAENSVLKKTLEDKVAPKSADDETIQRDKEKEESLEKELEARTAELKLVQMSRDDALKQMEIFRELYGKTSSFADEKQREKIELEERAQLAENQVKLGLDLIRRQFTAREHALKEELERQRVQTHLVLTRDRRTDDDVRRRAALEPELREKINALQEEIHELETAQSNIIHQRDEALVEKHELDEQLQELRPKYEKALEDLTWSQIQVDRLTAREKAFKKVFLTTSASNDGNESDRGEERVYVCKWLSGYDGRTRCNSLFTSVQDLKDHLFVDHQL